MSSPMMVLPGDGSTLSIEQVWMLLDKPDWDLLAAALTEYAERVRDACADVARRHSVNSDCDGIIVAAVAGDDITDLIRALDVRCVVGGEQCD